MPSGVIPDLQMKHASGRVRVDGYDTKVVYRVAHTADRMRTRSLGGMALFKA